MSEPIGRVRLVIDVVAGVTPMQGWITGPGHAEPVPFVGWMELAGRVERVLGGGVGGAGRPEGGDQPLR